MDRDSAMAIDGCADQLPLVPNPQLSPAASAAVLRPPSQAMARLAALVVSDSPSSGLAEVAPDGRSSSSSSEVGGARVQLFPEQMATSLPIVAAAAKRSPAIAMAADRQAALALPGSGLVGAASNASSASGSRLPWSREQLDLIFKLARKGDRVARVVGLQDPEDLAMDLKPQGLVCDMLPLTLASMGQTNRRAYEKNKRLSKKKKRAPSPSSGEDNDAY